MDINKILKELTLKWHKETPGYVVGVGYGLKKKDDLFTNEECIVFTVTKKKPKNEIPENEILPKIITYSGLSFTTDVVEGTFNFVVDCPMDFYTWFNTPPINRSPLRPLKGGGSTTNYTSLSQYIGTLGFLAVDSIDGSLVGVSNNHVYCHEAFYASDRDYVNGPFNNTFQNVTIQPHPGDSSYPTPNIGVVKRYVPISPLIYNYADTALTTINQSDISYSESWKIAGLTGWTQPMTFASPTELDNMLITKPPLFSSGRTTGPKGEGTMKLLISQIFATITINYKLQNNYQRVLMTNCMFFVASASTTPAGSVCPYPLNAGDSGSALLAEFSGERKIAGLIFAGQYYNGAVYSGIANRIDDVADAIKIHPWTGQTVQFSDIDNAESYCIQGLGYDKYIIISGKTFWQVGLCEP
jgi:hypothetical protein